MSDFFTELLDASFSQMSVLKPRLPALFEPLSPRVELVGFEDAAEMETQAAPPTASQADARAATRPLSPQVSPPAPYRGVMLIPPAAHTNHNSEASTHDDVYAQRAGQRLDLSPEASQTERDAAKGQVEQKGERRHPIENSRVVASAVSALIRPAVVRERGNTALSGERAAGENVLPEPAPRVRVTIGRIVVRAVAAPSPAAPKRQAEAKKLSLDEYLKQGKRGEP